MLEQLTMGQIMFYGGLGLFAFSFVMLFFTAILRAIGKKHMDKKMENTYFK